MNKKAVYTVITSNGYKLIEPTFINNDWDYICFTNQDIQSDNWKIIKVKNGNLTNQKLSRKIKILSHKFLPKHNLTIYIDSKFTVTSHLNTLINTYLPDNQDMAVMRHNRRNCAYDEIDFLIKNKIGSPSRLQKQYNHYASLGFPRHFGLWAPGIMIRRNNGKVRKFMNLWFNEIMEWTYRDIVSFSFILWEYTIKVNAMPFRETYELFKRRNNND